MARRHGSARPLAPSHPRAIPNRAHPILTCTAATAIGLALMVPNVLAILMLVAIAVSMQVQVRLVEEPDLTSVHGDSYRRYAARTGRFFPGIGRLSA